MERTVDFPKSYVEGVLEPFNTILTFVCRLSGSVRFVCARDADTAEDTTVHLINNVIRHHGCPDRIIADNDYRLRAGFWKALTKRLGVDMIHTSPYNPRANGKVENTHSTLYDMLRSMVSRYGTNWAEHLPIAEFAFNSSICASTGFTPFQGAYGRQLSFPGDLKGPRSDVPRAEAAATRVIALTTACRDHFEQVQMDNQERVSRRHEVPLEIGDMVLLATQTLVSLKYKTACNCPNSRYAGPFRWSLSRTRSWSNTAARRTPCGWRCH